MSSQALDRLAGEIERPLVAVVSEINMPRVWRLQFLVEMTPRFPHRVSRQASRPERLKARLGQLSSAPD
jgi:hypothetical protein